MKLNLTLDLGAVNVVLNAMQQQGLALQNGIQDIQTQAQRQLQPPQIGGNAGPADQPEPGTAPAAPSNVVAVEFGPERA